MTEKLSPQQALIPPEHRGGVYSNTEIFAAIESGHIVHYPHNPDYVNGSSIDVTLGYNFYVTDRGTQEAGLYNPYDEEDVKRYFGEPLVAFPLRDHDNVRQKLSISALRGIPEDQPVIILRPNERILAHTHEFIGIKAPGTSSMQARSTTGRNGIAVCIDAGWGDPGYINRWTMEIKNLNDREHVPVPVGVRIAQLVFYHTGIVRGEYASLSGKYQSTSADDLNEIKALWTPRQMLPKAYKDKIMLPPIVEGLAEGTL